MKRRAVPFRLPALAQDALLGVLVAGMQVQGTLARPMAPGERPLDDVGLLGYGLLVVSGLVLALRRRWPAPVFVASVLLSLVYFGLDFPDGPGWIGLFVALYTLTAYGEGPRTLRIAGVGLAVLAVGWLVSATDVEPREAIGWVFFRITASVMAAVLGESVRMRKVIATDALERARQAERTREEEARSRVDAERFRIAREVHDTVAHAIAIINVQSGVTAYLLEKRPERAREALVTIEQTSSQALHEMRAVLGVLRDDDDGRAPHPGLGRIDDLVALARDAGLDVELESGSRQAPLPSAVDTTAYRIVQESITNVIRHVGPTRVTVALDHGADVLEVRVTDDGGPDAADGAANGTGTGTGAVAGGPAEPGRGIVGMRERCQLLGGELTAGPRTCGGFEVKARLPLAPAGKVHS
jgi:signal transduction histidine kinase